MPSRMTRRSAVGLLGAGGLAGAIASAGASQWGLGSQAAPGVKAPTLAAGAVPEALQVGARFGRWTITKVHAVVRGALQVDVRDKEGKEFSLEILARDAAPPAARPPAEIGALAVYVCNGGDGWSATVEEQGLAAMGLARLLELRGQTGAIQGLLTHGDRVVAHGDVLSASFIA
jgi:hypothetical protein